VAPRLPLKQSAYGSDADLWPPEDIGAAPAVRQVCTRYRPSQTTTLGSSWTSQGRGHHQGKERQESWIIWTGGY
jgi:hypothetical protein